MEAPHVYIRLERGIQAKDVLEIRTGTEQNIELTSNITAQAGQKIRLNANNLRQIRKDMQVYRTRNNALIDDINVRFIQKEKQTDIYGKVTAKIGKHEVFAHMGRPCRKRKTFVRDALCLLNLCKVKLFYNSSKW